MELVAVRVEVSRVPLEVPGRVSSSSGMGETKTLKTRWEMGSVLHLWGVPRR